MTKLTVLGKFHLSILLTIIFIIRSWHKSSSMKNISNINIFLGRSWAKNGLEIEAGIVSPAQGTPRKSKTAMKSTAGQVEAILDVLN